MPGSTAHPGDVSSCPLCGGAARHAFTTHDYNRGVDRQPFRYARCESCHSHVLRNVPADLSRYYPSSYFEFPDLRALRLHAATETFRMDLLAPFAPRGRLVEIGPGNGIFAVQAKDAGYETIVVEVSEEASAYLRDVVGVDVVRSGAPETVLPDLPPSQAIVGWHVLEHLSQPWQLVTAAAANLAPGGVLVLATPNPRALGFRMLGPRWPHVDAPRHLFLLDHEALIAHAARHGLELVGLTDTDQGGRHWNAFTWHYLLRGADAGYVRDGFAHRTAAVVARLLTPIEQRGLRGAAYTVVLRKR